MFNMNRTRWGFDWSEFILGILFLVPRTVFSAHLRLA